VVYNYGFFRGYILSAGIMALLLYIFNTGQSLAG